MHTQTNTKRGNNVTSKQHCLQDSYNTILGKEKLKSQAKSVSYTSNNSILCCQNTALLNSLDRCWSV